MTNVRLDEELDKKLKQYSVDNNISKSSVVREALVHYFSKKEISQSPYARGMDLFGLEGSGDTDRSTTYKQKLKQKLHEKHTH